MIILIMISILRYTDIKRWKHSGRWVLVYGRRKTGKSYFVRNHVRWDRYYFVGRAGEILAGDETIGYETFVREVFQALERGETVVVDEFQRLPGDFLDRVHAYGVRGRLILVSSTLWLSRTFTAENSPLLGLFSEFKMTLIDERDILVNLARHIHDPWELMETAVFLREPWLVPVWEENRDIKSSLPFFTKFTVPALVGEIFMEEERSYSRVYEGILKAVADGKSVSGEIASWLFANHLIPANNPSLVHPYLNVLVKIGLLEKIKIRGKRKFHYIHSSPVMDLYYYMDAKYCISEREISPEQVKKVLKIKIPHYVEHFVRRFLSGIYGLWGEKIVERDHEIDVALTDFNSLKAVVEVKWRRDFRLDPVLAKLRRYNCRKILVVPDKTLMYKQPKDIEILDVADLVNLAKQTIT